MCKINAVFNLRIGNSDEKKIVFKFIASITNNSLYKIINIMSFCHLTVFINNSIKNVCVGIIAPFE